MHCSNDWWLATHHVCRWDFGSVFSSWAEWGVLEWAWMSSRFINAANGLQHSPHLLSDLWGQSNANPTHLKTPFDRQMTTAMMKGFVLSICLFFTVVQSITCEANRIEARKKHENDVAHHSSAITTGNTYYIIIYLKLIKI